MIVVNAPGIPFEILTGSKNSQEGFLLLFFV